MKSPLREVLLCLAVSCTAAMAQNPASPSRPASASLVSAHTPALPPPRPVARVNGAVLTDRDLLREMYTVFPYAKQHNGSFPRAMEADVRRGALKMIEFEELAYQEAKRRQMTIAPERLAAAEKQFRQQFGDEQQYETFLQTEAGGSKQVLRSKIRRSLLIEDFLRAEVNQKSAVSVAEAKAFYLKHPERFEVPENYALQTISILPPRARNAQQAAALQPAPEELKQMRERAEEALQRAKATQSYEEFGLLAEKISEDDYRVMMGDHRAVRSAELPPAILLVVSKMRSGEVSGLLLVEGVFTIVRLNAHNPARLQKFAEAEAVLRAQMQRSKAERLRREWDARLREKAQIEEL